MNLKVFGTSPAGTRALQYRGEPCSAGVLACDGPPLRGQHNEATANFERGSRGTYLVPVYLPIELDPKDPKIIHTAHGVGYRFE